MPGFALQLTTHLKMTEQFHDPVTGHGFGGNSGISVLASQSAVGSPARHWPVSCLVLPFELGFQNHKTDFEFTHCF